MLLAVSECSSVCVLWKVVPFHDPKGAAFSLNGGTARLDSGRGAECLSGG